MAVVTPDGIVGKIIAAYPSASEMLLVTDPDFAAGVVSSNGVRGTLKGQGNPTICKVDYVPVQEKIEPGEMLYTSGDDRVFPRGFTVGQVKEVRNAQPFKEIYVEPSRRPAWRRGRSDFAGGSTSGDSADAASEPTGVYRPAPPGARPIARCRSRRPPQTATPGTDADRLRQQYKAVGDAQNHVFGEGTPGKQAARLHKDAGRPDARQAEARRRRLRLHRKLLLPPRRLMVPSRRLRPDAARRANQANGPGPGGLPLE